MVWESWCSDSYVVVVVVVGTEDSIVADTCVGWSWAWLWFYPRFSERKGSQGAVLIARGGGRG